MQEKEMVDNLVKYFKNRGLKVRREVRTHLGVIDILLPELDIVMEVKKDAKNLHSALGQLLSYYRGARYHAISNPKLVLIYLKRPSDVWCGFFNDYKIDAISYYGLLDDDYDISLQGITWKEIMV